VLALLLVCRSAIDLEILTTGCILHKPFAPDSPERQNFALSSGCVQAKTPKGDADGSDDVERCPPHTHEPSMARTPFLDGAHGVHV
jgi:hypothetical protein